jgi:predicted RNase H-like HicB family nuclease
MEIPVLVEPVDSRGFRARSGEPLGLTAEGATRDEALQKLRELVQSRVADGELTLLEVGPFSHPWDRFVGKWSPDDPFIAEWEKEVEKYRREVDEDPNIP